MSEKVAGVVRIVSLEAAKAHLSRLVREVFIMIRSGRPVARVLPIRNHASAPRVGFMPEITVPVDFNEMGSTKISSIFGTP